MRINPNAWKARFVPLYGYVIEDLHFTWLLGVKGFLGIRLRRDNRVSVKYAEELKSQDQLSMKWVTGPLQRTC